MGAIRQNRRIIALASGCVAAPSHRWRERGDMRALSRARGTWVSAGERRRFGHSSDSRTTTAWGRQWERKRVTAATVSRGASWQQNPDMVQVRVV